MQFFYQPGDTFSKTISGALLYELSDDCRTITKLQEHGRNTFASIFGEQLIESMDNNTVYSWTFKITECSLYFAMGISATLLQIMEFIKIVTVIMVVLER